MIKIICKKLSYGELAYCIYYLHMVRISKSKLSNLKNFEHMSLDRLNDVLNHSISCIFKYANISRIQKNDYSVNENSCELIIKLVDSLHNLHEKYSLLTLLDEFELEGERNQHIKIDISKITIHPDKMKYFEYVARFQTSINIDKEETINHTIHLKNFVEKYSKYNLISKDIFGLEIEEISDKLSTLLNICKDNIMRNRINIPSIEDDIIDHLDIKTLRETIKSFIFNEKELLEIFGKKGMKFIREFIFKKSVFKSYEMNYHYILRSPILKIKNEYIISPELLVDSLFLNFHYTLLENKQHSEKHKKIMSDAFVNEILDISKKYGFVHFGSEVELYQGKNKLGDIDLILRHKKLDLDILIEAKNHAVPLPVYHGIYEKINKRFEELKKDWESKVHKRYIHLIDNNEKYNIKKTFKYLIVTKYPEILSHDSDYLVLTIDEFNFYLQNDFQFSNFRDLCDELYKHKKLDEQEIIKLMKVLNCKIK